MTGTMYSDGSFTFRGTGGTYDQRPYNGTVYSKGFRHTVNTTNNFYAIAPVDETGSANFGNQIRFDGDTGKLTMKELAVGTDNQVDISVTADATLPDSNYVLNATRRANTVTLSGAITVNAGASGSAIIVATIPSGYRPTRNQSMYTIVTDNTAHTQIFINASTGALAFTAGAKGKRVDFSVSYVVN
jgi:hypothetical protein